MDTRESSESIAATLTAGLVAGGASVENAGVITTPAVAHLTHTHHFSAGVVISASHNPWQDNGIKLFGPDGYKLPDATELAIEAEIFKQLESSTDNRQLTTNDPPRRSTSATAPTTPASSSPPSLASRWTTTTSSWTVPTAPPPPSPRSSSPTSAAPSSSPTPRPTAATSTSAAEPSTPRSSPPRSSSTTPHLGITFDGDADRVLLADEHGNVVNGDAILLLAARDLHAAGRLANATVVATTMSNMGLEAALSRSGIKMLRAPVGDKYVLEQMLATGATLGGEQSGHIIFAGRSTTGDGLLTALLVLDILHRAGKSLAELTADLKTFPQVILNVKVREKVPLDTIPTVAAAIAHAEQALAGTGRVVIRYSGTESLARVMIEAEDESLMTSHAQAIAQRHPH